MYVDKSILHSEIPATVRKKTYKTEYENEKISFYLFIAFIYFS